MALRETIASLLDLCLLRVSGTSPEAASVEGGSILAALFNKSDPDADDADTVDASQSRWSCNC